MSGPTARTYESVLSTSARIQTASTAANINTHANPINAAETTARVRADRCCTRAQYEGNHARSRIIHNVIPRLFLYRSTGREAYVVHMGFEVHFEDDTTTHVLAAEAY